MNGILGTQLGDFQLGAGATITFVGVFVTQFPCEVIYTSDPHLNVSQNVVELLFASDPNILVSQVTAEIIYTRDPAVQLSHDVIESLGSYSPKVRATSVIAEILYTPPLPKTRFTQIVSEVLYSPPLPKLRFTHVPVEILYQSVVPLDRYFTTRVNVSQTINRTLTTSPKVTSSIIVKQNIAGQTNKQIVSSNVHIATIQAFYQPSKRLSITSNIAITQSLVFPHGRDFHNSVISNVFIGTPLIGRSQNVRLSIFSVISITQTVGIVGAHYLIPVVSNVFVASIVDTLSAVRIAFVTSLLSVNHFVQFRNTVIRISIQSNLNTVSSSGGVSDNLMESVESDLLVHPIIVASNTFVRIPVTQSLTASFFVHIRNDTIYPSVFNYAHITQIINAYNPNRYVSSAIRVVQIITPHSTGIPISIVEPVFVTQFPNPNFNFQTVESDIIVYGDLPNVSVFFTIMPLKIYIPHYVNVTSDGQGGPAFRNISVEDDVTIDSYVRVNRIEIDYEHKIEISSIIIGGSAIRNIMVQDGVTISQTAISRNTIHDEIVKDHIVVHPIVVSILNDELPFSIFDKFYVDSRVEFEILDTKEVKDRIDVFQDISSRPDPNRQFIVSDITISQPFHFSPNRQSITDSISVFSRNRELSPIVLSRIHVDQHTNITRDRLVIQTLPINQTGYVTRIIQRRIDSRVTVSPKIHVNHEYIRTISQRLYIPETDYLFPVNFYPYPIVVPVAVGTILVTTIMSLQGQHGAIQLPPAQFGDSIEAIGKMEIKKSMDGTAYSYIQRTQRQKLVYKWRLGHLKMYEFQSFIKKNLNDLITIINWKGETWRVRIMTNPFDFTNQSMWKLDKEMSEVAVEFEGVRIG